MSEWTVITFLTNVKIEKTAWFGLEEVMIDLVICLFVFNSQQLHVIIWPHHVTVVVIERICALRTIAVTIAG